MKMNNYLWLAIYIVVGLALLKIKDEFTQHFVPKLGYIGLWILWSLGIICISIGIIGGI